MQGIQKNIIGWVLLSLTVVAVIIAAQFYTATAVSALQTGSDDVSVPIIMYHSILKDPKRAGKYIISPEQFRNDMLYLLDSGYTPVFVSELCDYVLDNGVLPEKPIVITLDDGYLNNLTYVLPILEELDIKAVISVVGSFSENFTNNPDPNPTYAHVTWNDIKTLYESGHVEIGNHTYSMHSVSTRKGCKKKSGEDTETYRRILRADLEKLQIALSEKSGVTPTVFTYPFGYQSSDGIHVLRELGFTAVLTCEEKLNRISKDNPDCLYNLYRYNRPSGKTSAEFFGKILQMENK